jgi:serine/threonine protein kinase
MGTVYLARDRDLDRLVALKVVGPAGATAVERERLVHEARILAQLEHPGIVPVHDVGRTPDGRTFYVMKLVRGRGLDQHLTAALPVAERLQIFERLCDTVAFAHAHGVIHRDLKPENVMVGPFGEVLVMDWGVAKLRAAIEPSTVLGTPGYMAPEQARGDTALTDERSDVHALGALLRFILTGEAPARPLQAIIRKATATNPDDRYPEVVRLAADLARFRMGLPVEAYRERLVERVRRLLIRYRVPLGLVVAYLLMRVVLVIVGRG